MGHLVVKIAVIESERGYGRKIDDYMVCLSISEALDWKASFNRENNLDSTPDWYMMCEGEPEPIEISDTQYKYLTENEGTVWLSVLNKL